MNLVNKYIISVLPLAICLKTLHNIHQESDGNNLLTNFSAGVGTRLSSFLVNCEIVSTVFKITCLPIKATEYYFNFAWREVNLGDDKIDTDDTVICKFTAFHWFFPISRAGSKLTTKFTGSRRKKYWIKILFLISPIIQIIRITGLQNQISN